MIVATCVLVTHVLEETKEAEGEEEEVQEVPEEDVKELDMTTYLAQHVVMLAPQSSCLLL